MSQPKMTPQKRPRPGSNPGIALNETEHQIYQIIMSKKELGIFSAAIKKFVVDIPEHAIKKAVEALKAKKLVKLVTHVNRKSGKVLMGMNFEPAKEISGGSWYSDDGHLDTEFVGILTAQCLKHIRLSEVATIDSLLKSVEKSPIFTTKITRQQIIEIVGVMVLDGQVVEEKKSGRGGMPCYRFVREKAEPKVGTFSSIPCGACSIIGECMPGGIICPETCVYYSKWLGLDF